MKNLLSFEEYINENYIQEATDADGFDPAKGNVTDPEKGDIKATTGKNNDPGFTSDQAPDKIASPVSTISDMKPGKEYVLTVDGKKHTDMLYQGVTDGVHIFNGEDKAHDITFTDSDLSSVISKGGVVEVAE
jgi:hypothetical protein